MHYDDAAPLAPLFFFLRDGCVTRSLPTSSGERAAAAVCEAETSGGPTVAVGGDAGGEFRKPAVGVSIQYR